MKYASGEPKQAEKKHINRYKMAHMIGVAEYMRENAEKYGLDPDKMYAVGLLHDIGYLRGRVDHEINSVAIAELADEMANTAILCHGQTPAQAASKQYFTNTDELLEKNPILVLLYEADMSIDATGYNVGYYGRLSDIGERYGYDHIAYKTAYETVTYLKGLEMLDAFKDISAVDTDKIYSFFAYTRLLPLKENGIKQFTLDELFSKLSLKCIPIKETSIAKITESLKEEMGKKYLIVPIPYEFLHGKEKGKKLIRFYLCELPEDYK